MLPYRDPEHSEMEFNRGLRTNNNNDPYNRINQQMQYSNIYSATNNNNSGGGDLNNNNNQFQQMSSNPNMQRRMM